MLAFTSRTNGEEIFVSVTTPPAVSLLLRFKRTLLHLADLGLLLIDGGAQQREDDARLRVDADRGHDDLAGALHHVRAGQHHRIVGLALLDVIGLAGQRRFVHLAGAENAVVSIWCITSRCGTVARHIDILENSWLNVSRDVLDFSIEETINTFV